MDEGLFYGTFRVYQDTVISGMEALLVSENPTQYDVTVRLAVNGIPQAGTDFVIPAGTTVDSVTFPGVAFGEGDFVSVYCVSKDGNEEVGVALEISLTMYVDNETDTIIKRLLRCFESETSIQKDFIQAIGNLVDIEACPQIYLNYIGRFLGFSVVSTLPIERKRMFLKSLVRIWKHSGRKLSFEAILNIFSYSTIVYELYKKDIYETVNYSRTGFLSAKLSEHCAFYPGSLVDDATLYGFQFPTNTKIQGMEVNVSSRHVDSGIIRVYLTVNGVVDDLRYVDIRKGDYTGISDNYNFPELLVDETDLIGFRIVVYDRAGVPAGIDDGWVQIYLKLEINEDRLHSARIELGEVVSDEVLDWINILKPIHVLFVRTSESGFDSDRMYFPIIDTVPLELLENFTSSLKLDATETLVTPTDSRTLKETCVVTCETGVELITTCDDGCCFDSFYYYRLSGETTKVLYEDSNVVEWDAGKASCKFLADDIYSVDIASQWDFSHNRWVEGRISNFGSKSMLDRSVRFYVNFTGLALSAGYGVVFFAETLKVPTIYPLGLCSVPPGVKWTEYPFSRGSYPGWEGGGLSNIGYPTGSPMCFDERRLFFVIQRLGANYYIGTRLGDYGSNVTFRLINNLSNWFGIHYTIKNNSTPYQVQCWITEHDAPGDPGDNILQDGRIYNQNSYSGEVQRLNFGIVGSMRCFDTGATQEYGSVYISNINVWCGVVVPSDFNPALNNGDI